MHKLNHAYIYTCLPQISYICGYEELFSVGRVYSTWCSLDTSGLSIAVLDGSDLEREMGERKWWDERRERVSIGQSKSALDSPDVPNGHHVGYTHPAPNSFSASAHVDSPIRSNIIYLEFCQFKNYSKLKSPNENGRVPLTAKNVPLCNSSWFGYGRIMLDGSI